MANSIQRDRRLDLGSREFTRRDINKGYTRGFLIGNDCRKEIVGIAHKHVRLNHRPWCNHTHHFAWEKTLHRPIPHLFANRHVISLFD